ncbi:hypothetical protein PCK1_001715 [Pneumocystis canis]|nr:hypothetical protein PCK1_001715 [Pneumocystis canis]
MSKKYKTQKKDRKEQNNQHDILKIQKKTFLPNKNIKIRSKLKESKEPEKRSKKSEHGSKNFRTYTINKDLEEIKENKLLSDKNYNNDFKTEDQVSNIDKSSSINNSDMSSSDSYSPVDEFEDNNNSNNKKNLTSKVVSIKDNNQKENQDSLNGDSNVVYLGRIPHGFYELEMKNYFKQFGTVTRIKLSRNKKTGKSKHYAFIEFDSPEVAKIVAKTMNNYLLFEHILKCSVVPKNKIHESMFIGANKRFKPIPWSKITKKHLEEPKTKEQWIKLQKKKEKCLEKKMILLKKLGIIYQYNRNVMNK